MYCALVALVVCVISVSGNNTTIADAEQDGLALVYHGNVTSPKAVPWHVGVYEVKGPVNEYLCGGTLIAPKLVVTAAHCFWDLQTKRRKTNAFKVVLGKVYREWHFDSTNPSVQRMDVEQVFLDELFRGYVDGQLPYDIALLQLEREANLTTEDVQLAHLAKAPGLPANGCVGVVAGWGRTEEDSLSQVLRSIELPYVDIDKCFASLGLDRFKKLLTLDKFCAGYENQRKSVCPGDSGGGFVVLDRSTNMAMLGGVVSIDFRPSNFPRHQCYSLHYTSFTAVGTIRSFNWINSVLKAVGSGRTCPPLTSDHIDFTCHLDGQKVNCTGAGSKGARATMTCKAGYVLKSFTPRNTRQCTDQGVWSGSMLDCVPDCGRRNTAGGSVLTASEFPWHIGFYYVRSDWLHRCSGTLVTPSLVVTAAHCVTRGGQKLDTSEYKLAAGKYHRAWDAVEDAVQRRDIAEFVVHPDFRSRVLTADIAVVRVVDPFVLSTRVNVICIDWQLETEDLSLASEANGTFVGWGLSIGQDEPSDVLVSSQVPFIPNEVCKSLIPRPGIQYVTSDKICGGWVNDEKSLCPGTSGVGFVFPRPAARGAKYYLRGVVSGALRLLENSCASITSFVKVSSHFTWLQDTVFPNN